MTTKLYLMRHGQTRFNQQQRIQGATDSPLTELGIEQALAACAYFNSKAITFDRIYSSTQERACDTAELASGRTDYIRLKGLKEIDFGAFEGQQEFLNPPLQKDIGYGDYFVTYGGESSLAVRARMGETMRQIVSENEGKTVLVVSHGGAIAQFYRGVLKNPPQVRMRNCAILEFDVADGQFDLLTIYDPVNHLVLYDRISGEHPDALLTF
ncbi:histidine phosphatase family protein [Streptococcus merionis]|uniref:histidine phosphatase family protein n=1 Tax=Streptococcus merionis TaxID=400065 RepID=UPI003517F37D